MNNELLTDVELGFPVADRPFDQKHEMFKRVSWDKNLIEMGKRFRDEISPKEISGWGIEEYSAVAASWSIEHNFANGNARSGYGLYSWEGPNKHKDKHSPRAIKFSDLTDKSPTELTQLIKGAAPHFGAALVGICRVHPSWIYSHEFNTVTGKHYPFEFSEECNNAVVMAIEMDYKTIRSRSLVARSVTTGHAYSMMAVVANQMATFIRSLGYRAIPSGNDSALSVPLAMAAGLGESSRMGLLITPEFGPRIRLCKVFTDMPLLPDSYRSFGVNEFCRTCKTCANKCPSQAISLGEPTLEGPDISNHSGVLKWYNDHKKCFEYWARIGTSCCQCIRVCPFNKPSGRIHHISRFLIKLRINWINTIFVHLDNIMGYQRQHPIERFWGI